MFAVVVRETGDAAEIDGGASLVSMTVAPRLREAPGFVSALWMSDGAGRTLNVIVFDSEETARRALEPARMAPRPPFMRVESVELFSVLAHLETAARLPDASRAGAIG